jgi:hypothetical protein
MPNNFFLFLNYFSILIASTGQIPSHVPHLMQTLWSIWLLPSTIEIALTGQAPSHAPQPIHFSLSTIGLYLLLFFCFILHPKNKNVKAIAIKTI